MILSLCSIITPHANLYMRKLCKHWAQKFPVQCYGSAGEVEFSHSNKVSFLVHHEMLSIHITTLTNETIEKLEQVLAEHLERFAYKENLYFSWQRDTLVTT